MNSDLSTASTCYGLFKDKVIVGFLAVIHFPHPRNKKIKKVHRLVILPDYQGIGLGVKFLNEVAKIYKDYDFIITTSAKNLINALNKNASWTLKRYGRTKAGTTYNKTMMNSFRGHVKTASFKYINQ